MKNHLYSNGHFFNNSDIKKRNLALAKTLSIDEADRSKFEKIKKERAQKAYNHTKAYKAVRDDYEYIRTFISFLFDNFFADLDGASFANVLAIDFGKFKMEPLMKHFLKRYWMKAHAKDNDDSLVMDDELNEQMIKAKKEKQFECFIDCIANISLDNVDYVLGMKSIFEQERRSRLFVQMCNGDGTLLNVDEVKKKKRKKK